MQVFVDKPKCTGCSHCKDVCPVSVFEMVKLTEPMEKINADKAPDNEKWTGAHDPVIHDKFKDIKDGHTHFTEKSVGVNGESCILCQACLIECEGECITILDDTGNNYHSIYK